MKFIVEIPLSENSTCEPAIAALQDGHYSPPLKPFIGARGYIFAEGELALGKVLGEWKIVS
jgi:hypothetical protein